nr:reverse transcriptase domain-containing protein [Tanacetum cinerariifolium]
MARDHEPKQDFQSLHFVGKTIREQFDLYPFLKTTNLKNDITNFQQRFDETFSEAWDRFNDLLRKCPHHGFSELHQIDTFYNSLTQSDQDSLNAAASGNLLNRTPRDALTIIENKSKVCISQNKLVVSKVNTTSSFSSPSLNITALTDIVKELVLLNKANQQASIKAVEETCVTCGGPHPYYECLATGGNTFDSCAAIGTYNQGGSLPSNTVANPRGDLKSITTRSGVAYDELTIPPTLSPLPKEVERKTEATKDKVQAPSSESTTHVQPPVVQVPILEPDVAPKPNPKPSTSGNPTPSDPIITSSSPSFTPFEGNDFILEEIESFLRTPYEFSTLHDDFDPEGDIALIENLLNEDPSPNLPPMKNEDLKQADATITKSSIE